MDFANRFRLFCGGLSQKAHPANARKRRRVLCAAQRLKLNLFAFFIPLAECAFHVVNSPFGILDYEEIGIASFGKCRLPFFANLGVLGIVKNVADQRQGYFDFPASEQLHFNLVFLQPELRAVQQRSVGHFNIDILVRGSGSRGQFDIQDILQRQSVNIRVFVLECNVFVGNANQIPFERFPCQRAEFGNVRSLGQGGA